MRISYSKTKNSVNYYIIDDYNGNGKRTTKIANKIGNYNNILEQTKKENMDVDTWLKSYLKKYLINNGLLSTEQTKAIIKKASNTNSLNEETEKTNYYYSYSIDQDKIKEEEIYDGYYGITKWQYRRYIKNI